ncbi:PREDICTED: metal homeostasis factor atx1-like [Priapulus caudatus]|uniref:Copper transport protein ATOX1 n=1 Tax=Priapulus caudatus TaxID=37621 RepID=A0ABM1ESI9_PRICU|nr:PREDICTED: metal homeostasis factor atx1-like [Priapulus caudatus]
MATKTYEFDFAATCEGCTNAAKRVLGKINVTDVEADIPKQKLWVTTDLPMGQILETIKKTGKATSFVGEKSA